MTQPASGQQIADTLLEEIRQVAGELRPGSADSLNVSLDSSLDKDLGLDSLARMELLVRIERCFDLALPESLFADANTPRELLRAILDADKPRQGSATAAEREVIDTSAVESAP